jgi:hypothetical protein
MRSLSLALLFSVAAACGSSGGGAAPIAPAATFEPTVSASVANAADFAKVGVRGVFDLPNLAYICGGFLRLPVPQAASAPVASLSAEVAGPAGGSAVYSLDDHDGDLAFSTGDVVTIDFNGYAAGDFTLDGIVIIDDLRTLGAVTQGGGTFIVDATLRMLNLQYQLGAGAFTLNTELPFRLENRELLEIFDLPLFEDTWIGELEYKAGAHWSRLHTSDDLVVEASGTAYSPAIDGVLSFSTSNFVYLNETTFDLDSGVITVDGAAGSFVEIEKEVPSPANFNCFFFGIGCGFDVRVEEDGEEGFEATQQMPPAGLLPQ